MQQLRRIIVEDSKSDLHTSSPVIKKHQHHSKSARAKHKLRQINYEKAIRAYIGYLACNVSENSAFASLLPDLPLEPVNLLNTTPLPQ